MGNKNIKKYYSLHLLESDNNNKILQLERYTGNKYSELEPIIKEKKEISNYIYNLNYYCDENSFKKINKILSKHDKEIEKIFE